MFSYILRNGNFLELNFLGRNRTKKFLIFSQKEAFLIFRKTETVKTSYISISNFPSSKNEKNHSEKISYILGNGTF